MKEANPKKVGELLLSRGLLTEAQLTEALEAQTTMRHKKLGDYLVERGYVTEKDVILAVKAQAEQSYRHTTYVRTDSKKIDLLMDLVGELVVIKSLLQGSAGRLSEELGSQSTVSLLDKTVRELYDNVLAMRMTSLQKLFIRIDSTVAQLSTKLNKKIAVTTQGGATELDRAVIDHLYNPLLHLCRNAIDHGIESPQQRKDADKDINGQITITAHRSGSNVLIDVEDDGRGIDAKRILEAAIEKGVMSESESTQLTEKEIYDIVFHSGFSTTSQVSDVSGRGVGLDLVKATIANLGGRINLKSKLGRGTRFRITLPLTTAITDGFLLRIGDDKFILPVETVREFVQFSRIESTKIENGAELVRVREEYLPLIPLNDSFAIASRESGLIVVIETSSGKAGVLVDEVIGQSQIVLKNLRTDLGQRGVSGAAILGDGRVGLVLDVNDIFSRQQARETAS